MSCTFAAVQVAAAGAPAQAKDALPEKPGPGVNRRLKVAVCPALTVTEVEPGAAGAIERAGLTVAVSPTVCGELGASSAMAINADRAPVMSGAIEAPTVHVAPTA